MSTQQYFSKVKKSAYIDKNKLDTELKRKLNAFDHTLINGDKHLARFIKLYKEEWQRMHIYHSRCNPITLTDSADSDWMLDSGEKGKSRALGNRRIGWLYIYSVESTYLEGISP